MVKSHLIVHVLQIVGLFICAHHLWPKGVTYGEKEEWEKEHRKRQHSHSHKSKSKRGSNSPVYEEAESPERPARGQRVRRRDRVDRDYEIEYQEHPRRREIEYDPREVRGAYEERERETSRPRYEERGSPRPRYERRASERY